MFLKTRFFAVLLALLPVAQPGYAQLEIQLSPEKLEAFLASINNHDLILQNAALDIAEILDPANHQCCVTAPPDTVELQISKTSIKVTSPDSSHWLNFTLPITEGTPEFEGETHSSVAGFSNVRNTFSGGIYENGIKFDATLGADGELYNQSITYSLEIETGDILAAAEPDVSAMTVERVRTLDGSATSASFAAGASIDGGNTFHTSFAVGENVTVTNAVNIDPADQGKAGEIHVVIQTVVDGKVQMYYLDENGDFQIWDLSIAGLGSAEVVDSLQGTHQISFNTGPLSSGRYRVALAYSTLDGKLVYAPKALIFTAD